MLGIIEGIIFYCSVYLGAFLRCYTSEYSLEELGPLYDRAFLFAALMLPCMVAIGLYQPQSRTKVGMSGIVLRLAVSFLLGSASLSMLFYIFPGLYLGRGVLALSAIIALLLTVSGRYIFRRIVDESLFKRRILILGVGKRAVRLADRIVDRDEKDIELLGFVPIPGEELQIDTEPLCMAESLPEFAKQNDVEEIVVSVDDRRKGFPLEILLDCKLDGVRILESIAFFERETGRLELDLLHPSWMVFSDGFNFSSVQNTIMRAFDLAVSLLFVVVLWPVMLCTVIAILCEDGRQASYLYRQERVGLNGKTFNVYKFRSMREDAEKLGAQWAQENDPRITKVGRFIRNYRIDELPQIINVLRGDMGFVGPRPERPQFVEQLQLKNAYFVERHRVKPGITGWAQLNYPYGASEDDAFRKLEYDLYYVKNRSLLLDLLILIRTVEVILFGKGSR